jgi:NitT/TauT family transport system permease protein
VTVVASNWRLLPVKLQGDAQRHCDHLLRCHGTFPSRLASTEQSRGLGYFPCSFQLRFPHIFTRLKIGVTFAVIGAVVGEFVGAGNGLGYVLMTANGRLDTATLFAAIGVLVIMGMVLFAAVSLLERLMIPWHVTQRTVDTSGSAAG